MSTRSRGVRSVSAGLLAVLLGASTACAPDPAAEAEDCSVEGQNQYLYDWMQDWYLWAEIMPDVEPSEFDGPKELMTALRSGEDRWSGVSDLEKTNDYLQNGARVVLGIVYTRIDDALVLKQVLLESPAEAAGLRRSDKIVSINGKTLPEIDAEDLWSEIWGENEAGVEVVLGVETLEGARSDVAVPKQEIEVFTVPYTETFDRGGRTIGYVMFTSFIEPSKDDLTAAFTTLQDAGATEVVIDLRYNGGGLLSIAQHLASLIVPAEAIGERMYTAENNAAHADENWWRNFVEREAAIAADKVVFITTGRTVSASELVINALRPYMTVGTVGTTTAGKPFGMKFVEYCDKLMSPVTFRMVNALGEGHYSDGMEPDCPAVDDLDRQLGDPLEGSLATALEWLDTGQCPAAPALVDPSYERTLQARGTGPTPDLLAQLYDVR